MTFAKSAEHVQRLDFLTGGGTAGALMRALDWTGSPLGQPTDWPQPLKTLVGVMLGSNQPMFVVWGPGRTLLYNDAYAEILAAKHPEAMGRDFLQAWHEIRDDLLPIVEQTYGGAPVHMDDIELRMERKGYPEETHFSFFYAPVRDEAGRVRGLYCACNEITGQVLADRRRREAEAALRFERDRTRRVLDGMAEGFAMLDREFRVIDINAEGLRLERRPLEDIIGKTHWEAWPGSEDSELGRLYKQAMAERVALSLDHLFVWPGGTETWLETRAYPTDDGLALFWRDITERKRAEARLRESESRFRVMADAVPQIVWITDADGRAEFFNRQWADYTGSSTHPDTAAEAAADHVHPDDSAATIAAFDAARNAGTAFSIEHRIRSRTGDYRWFLVRGEPYREAETGEILRWFGASVDIHDRKLAEAALRELNETLEAQVAARSAERDRLWNLSQDMFARADYSGMMSAVSPAWTQVLGWTQGELLSRGYATFMHPDDMPPTLAAIERMAQSRQPSRFENRIATRDGGWKPIEWTVAPEPDGVNFIAVGRDLSLAKAREAELEIAQEALRQSQKMEAMGSLTGGVAHDFNNLLTPIIGSLDMLVRKGVGSERERRLIDGALQSAERAKTLVQRLLAFARRQPLQPTAVDAARLVESMAGLIASTLGPTIELRIELEPNLPAARADPNQLEMALLNLAVNARDAMAEGGDLIISAKMETASEGHPSGLQAGRYVRLAVSDTGSGMDEATCERAVEPFFSTKGIGKGTGLGLSMVHGLAAQLGGGLAIDSAIGRGTTVELWLPVSVGPIGEEEACFEVPQKPVGRGTALLVDDEELVRMSTADMLNDFGFEVVEVGSAEEALKLIERGIMPDLLVTDHLMPGMSGAELAREARDLCPALPVLIVSGYAEVDGIAADLPRLTKPFRNADLAASLSALLPEAAD